MARAISVLGTASDVGKSLVSVGLCHLLADAGFDVVPFKAQNMSNQAGVTADGLEMPRAQILQALACRKAPHVDMGPVLLKPVSQTGAQVIALGKALGIREAADYFRDSNPLRELAAEALGRLLGRHELVVLEGAGSPVELNLMDRDFVNLVPARQANAALILVADIDKGGVFPQIEGTLALLPPTDRERVLGVVFNRFRGDARLFDDGVRILEAHARAGPGPASPCGARAGRRGPRVPDADQSAWHERQAQGRCGPVPAGGQHRGSRTPACRAGCGRSSVYGARKPCRMSQVSDLMPRVESQQP
ncbi:MAG: cobyric acid synthase [Polyangiaceae bacterium]|nr:cobyric acid synthase [Polyangiaceae bacterium]